MFAKPQAEHQRLEQLVGTWRFRHTCKMPDGTESTESGTMVCRTLHGMWLLAESTGDVSSDTTSWSNLLTVGYDTEKKEYVGTFISSMMSSIWAYRGTMDEPSKQLHLYTEGPKFDGSGIGKYRDTIEWVDDDRWLFLSALEGDDGVWIPFMESEQKRVSS
ncbi:hypothetical protein VN12_05165 [Pirellula sp. SH-Sr6A]|uniref:DUF1579 domain-containing protein n=1 Tax=Pirellula sp. SH-Sr6A TaxID=1632865 RepID=UPI00078E9D3F|nr:DUF1579 domain-containing protein [Pirellula sp. SH-Sr6A]AMV31486.1 hypothetical protein VN12_05165 [Pirellula sp. SH-Sr6A]